MPERVWVKLDAMYWYDRKVQRLSPLAELLFVRALADAKQRLTDGVIERPDLDHLSLRMRGVDIDALVDELTRGEEPLWTPVDDETWLISAWSMWNRSAGELDEMRAAKRAAAALGNHRRWHVQKGVTDPRCEHCTDGMSDRTSDRTSDRSTDRTSDRRSDRRNVANGSHPDRTSIANASPETETETETETERRRRHASARTRGNAAPAWHDDDDDALISTTHKAALAMARVEADTFDDIGSKPAWIKARARTIEADAVETARRAWSIEKLTVQRMVALLGDDISERALLRKAEQQ